MESRLKKKKKGNSQTPTYPTKVQMEWNDKICALEMPKDNAKGSGSCLKYPQGLL